MQSGVIGEVSPRGKHEVSKESKTHTALFVDNAANTHLGKSHSTSRGLSALSKTSLEKNAKIASPAIAKKATAKAQKGAI